MGKQCWTACVPLSQCGNGDAAFSKLHANLLSEETLDPEEGIPALVLTFGFPAGRLCTVTTSLPKLRLRTRGRLLKAYADTAADTQADSILIGGACADQILFVENQISKLDTELEIYTNAHLCLLAHSSENEMHGIRYSRGTHLTGNRK